MKILHILLLSIILLMPTLSCSDSRHLENPIPVNIGDPQLQKEVIHKLDKQKIWHKVISPTVIEVKPDSSDKVISILNETTAAILPEGLHATFDPEVQKMLLEKLSANNIPYSVVTVFESEWVVWESKYTEQIHKIIDEITLPQ